MADKEMTADNSGMTEVPLTNNKIAIVDICDAHFSEYKWYWFTGYAVRCAKRDDEGKQKQIFLHHCVVGRPLNGFHVDHINGNTLDNRRNNLRIIDPRGNWQNRIENRNGKLSGTYKVKGTKKWASRIVVKGKRKYLGCFPTEIEAHSAYIKACEEVNLNG